MTEEASPFRVPRRTGLPFEVRVTERDDGKKDVLIRSNHLFVGGQVLPTPGPSGISKHHPQSLGSHVLTGTLDPATGELFVGWMSTIQPGQGIGTEMLGTAVEAVGASAVRTVSGELGATNRRVFEALRRKGTPPPDAVRETPLGRSLRRLGLTLLRFDEVTLLTAFSWGGPET